MVDLIPCHRIVQSSSTVSAIDTTYAQRMMGRLDIIPSNIQRLSCTLIGSIFYDMV